MAVIEEKEHMAVVNRRKVEESNKLLFEMTKGRPAPFILDGKSTDHLQEKLNDPEYQKTNPTMVLSATKIEETLKNLDPALAKKLHDKSWDKISAEEYVTAIKAGFSQKPELGALLLGRVDSVVQARKADPLAYRDEYPGDEIAKKHVLGEIAEMVFSPSGFGVQHVPEKSEENKNPRHFAIITLADDKLKPNEFLDNAGFANLGKAKIDPQKIPGTPAQWAKFINYHEMEHFHGQTNLDDYFDDVNKKTGLDTDSLRAREIESDLAAVEALKNEVPADVFKYWAAKRILNDIDIQNSPSGQMGEYQIFGNMGTFSSLRDPDKGYPVYADLARSRHGTGFFLNEYVETGHVPDYFATNHAQNGFYHKLFFEYHRAAAEVYVQSHPKTSLKNLMDESKWDERSEFFKSLPKSPPVDVLIDVARKTMKTDPAIFNEREMQIAQTFVTSLQDTMGLQPRDVATMDADMKEARELRTKEDAEWEMKKSAKSSDPATVPASKPASP